MRRPRTIRLARTRAAKLDAGRPRRFRIRFGRRARIRLRRRRKPLRARLIVTAVDRAGNRTYAVRTVRVGRCRASGSGSASSPLSSCSTGAGSPRWKPWP